MADHHYREEDVKPFPRLPTRRLYRVLFWQLVWSAALPGFVLGATVTWLVMNLRVVACP